MLILWDYIETIILPSGQKLVKHTFFVIWFTFGLIDDYFEIIDDYFWFYYKNAAIDFFQFFFFFKRKGYI